MNDNASKAAEHLREFLAHGGSLDDPFLPTQLRDLALDQLRAGQRTRSDEQLVVQAALDNGLAELITYATTNEQIAAYVVAAEAGAGGPIRGLHAELIRRRDAEHREWRRQVDEVKEQLLIDEAKRQFEAEEFGDDADAGRVFVGGRPGDPVRICIPDPVSGKAVPVFASGSEPYISNLGEYADEFVQPGESRCRISTPDETPVEAVDWWALVDAQQKAEQGKTDEDEDL